MPGCHSRRWAGGPVGAGRSPGAWAWTGPLRCSMVLLAPWTLCGVATAQNDGPAVGARIRQRVAYPPGRGKLHGSAPLPSVAHGWAPGPCAVAIGGHSPGGTKDLCGLWVCCSSCLGYPTKGDGGLAWCGVCFGPWAAGNAWAALPPALLPAGLHASAADLASARRGLVGHGGWPVSRYGQCPLCSLGEAGAEHLLLWCPAVALAWNAWGRLAAAAPCGPAGGASATVGQGPSVLEAVRQAHGDVAYLATFLHQVAFLYSTLLGRACLEPERAAAWLIRACSRGSSDEESCDGAGLTLEGGLGEVEPHAWASDPPDCACGADPGAACGVVSDATPARTATGDFGGGRMVRWPVTRRSVEAGGCIGRLYASAAVAAWMPLGTGWWPRPRRVDDAHANADWVVTRCAGFGLARGCEILVRWSPAPAWEDGGSPECLARARAAIPWPASAQVAEAVGCRLALSLLTALRPERRAARVVGDNLAVVRYGAGTARLRQTELQAHLELGLGQALSAGWRLLWCAVRRRLNQAADALAAEGRAWADRLAGEGAIRIQARIDWAPRTPGAP